MTQFFFTFQQNCELVHIPLGTRLALIWRKRWRRAVAWEHLLLYNKLYNFFWTSKTTFWRVLQNQVTMI